MPFLEAALFSIENSVPCLFTTSQQNVSTADRVVYEISNLCKQKVHTISLAQSTDTTDLIGQFEQFSMQSIILDFHSKFQELLKHQLAYHLLQQNSAEIEAIQNMYEDIQTQGKCEDACVLDYVSRVGKVIPSALD